MPIDKLISSTTINDIPGVRQFVYRFFEDRDGNQRLGRDYDFCNSVRDLLTSRWQSFIEEKHPLIVGSDGPVIIGVAMVWTEKILEIFIEPNAREKFFTLILEGIIGGFGRSQLGTS